MPTLGHVGISAISFSVSVMIGFWHSRLLDFPPLDLDAFPFFCLPAFFPFCFMLDVDFPCFILLALFPFFLDSDGDLAFFCDFALVPFCLDFKSEGEFKLKGVIILLGV